MHVPLLLHVARQCYEETSFAFLLVFTTNKTSDIPLQPTNHHKTTRPERIGAARDEEKVRVKKPTSRTRGSPPSPRRDAFSSSVVGSHYAPTNPDELPGVCRGEQSDPVSVRDLPRYYLNLRCLQRSRKRRAPPQPVAVMGRPSGQRPRHVVSMLLSREGRSCMTSSAAPRPSLHHRGAVLRRAAGGRR